MAEFTNKKSIAVYYSSFDNGSVELSIFNQGDGEFNFTVNLTRAEAKLLRRKLKEALNDKS